MYINIKTIESKFTALKKIKLRVIPLKLINLKAIELKAIILEKIKSTEYNRKNSSTCQ